MSEYSEWNVFLPPFRVSAVTETEVFYQLLSTTTTTKKKKINSSRRHSRRGDGCGERDLIFQAAKIGPSTAIEFNFIQR